jgi:hypothetical protein
MARFLTHLVMEKVNGDDAHLAGLGTWCVHDPLVYESDVLAGTIVIPAGFCCDMASVPRIPLVWEFAGACAERAAVLHDYGYRHGTYRFEGGGVAPVTRRQVDALFYEAMRATGVKPWRAFAMWAAVRLFGWVPYSGK